MAAADSTKKLHLEILRILALCLVLYNHCGTSRMPTYAEWRLEYWYVLFMNITSKMAVPLFFMVSGALLLGREESYRRLFVRRVLRFVLLLAVFALVQWRWLVYSGCPEISLPELCRMVYDGTIQGGSPSSPFMAWFLYAYLALLLMLPLLRSMAQRMRNADFLYMMAMQFLLVALLPSLVHSLNGAYLPGEVQRNLPFMPLTETVPFTALYGAFYMLVGYYLENRADAAALQRHAGKLLAAALLCIVAGCAMVNLHRASLGLSMPVISCSYWCDFLLVPCVAVYVWCRRCGACCQPQGVCARLICLLGSGVFAGLLVENICRAAARAMLQGLPPMHNYVLYCIQMLLAIALALVVGVVLKRIPGLRRLV